MSNLKRVTKRSLLCLSCKSLRIHVLLLWNNHKRHSLSLSNLSPSRGVPDKSWLANLVNFQLRCRGKFSNLSNYSWLKWDSAVILTMERNNYYVLVNKGASVGRSKSKYLESKFYQNSIKTISLPELILPQ